MENSWKTVTKWRKWTSVVDLPETRDFADAVALDPRDADFSSTIADLKARVVSSLLALFGHREGLAALRRAAITAMPP